MVDATIAIPYKGLHMKMNRMEECACRLGLVTTLALGCAGALATGARAMPAGRSWAATQTLSLPGLIQNGTPLLEVNSDGTPRMVISAMWDTTATRRWSVLSWTDSLWANPLVSSRVGQNFPEPVFTLDDGAWYFLSLYYDYWPGIGYMLLSEITETAITVPDTAMLTNGQDTEYSAAVSHTRRWVARAQQIAANYVVRVAYSDVDGAWSELQPVGSNAQMCAIAPLSDSSAIVAYAGNSGLAWSRVEDEQWVEQGVIDPRVGIILHPTFRRRPSGGWWLVWSDRLYMHVSSYVDGVWDRGDSVTCVHNPGETFWSAWSDASRDTAERPVLGWGDLGVGLTYRDVGCLAFPTMNGWAPGDEIPGSQGLIFHAAQASPLRSRAT